MRSLSLPFDEINNLNIPKNPSNPHEKETPGPPSRRAKLGVVTNKERLNR
jgi:hypothetical protein